MELARANLFAAERDVLLREYILNRLITDNFEKWQDTRLEPAEKLLAIPETFDRGEAWINALEKRPDYASVKLQLERQGIQVKLRKNQLYPSLDLVGSYGRSGLDTLFGGSISDIERADNPTHTYGVVLSVPLFNQLERNRYRSAKEVENQLELEIKRIHQEILAGVDDAMTQAQSAFEQIPARRQAKTYAEQALDAEQKKYENGKSTSFFVLEFQRDLTSARAEEIRSLADYNRSLAEFYFSEGTILERNNILIEQR
jgi:outer membrane protein TolC